MEKYGKVKSIANVVDDSHVAFPVLTAILEGKPLPTEADRQKHNEKIREDLIKVHDAILRGRGKFPPNHSQCVACVDDDDRTLVLAGAGTGKTATIMTKTRYLVKTGKASPSLNTESSTFCKKSNARNRLISGR